MTDGPQNLEILVAARRGVFTQKSFTAKREFKREKHLRLAKITAPIWLYVSLTGVVVYVMLYWL